MRFATKTIHTGQEPDLEATGDVSIPIHMAATFARREIEKPTRGYEYSRTDNPTRTAFQKSLASLENAKHALAYASGLAAELNLLLLLKTGDHVVAFDDLYGGTRRLFEKVIKPFGIEFSYVDARNPTKVKASMKKNTKLVWLETPTNPLLKLADIKAVSKISHEAGALVVVDNTFASPAFQNPLDLGADVVVHSTTKYINGHSDAVGGAIMLNNPELYEKLKFLQNAAGATPSPFNDWLALRGTRTLALRMKKHEENAFAVAHFLEEHEKVARVIYPGLESHAQHALAKRQMTGFGGIVSFEVRGGLPSAKKFLSSLKIFSLAESLGGVESLIEHPALMTHASVPRNVREALGVSDGLVRASIGIEDKEDLIKDLEAGLKAIKK